MTLSVQDVSVIIGKVVRGREDGLSANSPRGASELRNVPRATLSAAIAYGVDMGALTLDDDYRVHRATP